MNTVKVVSNTANISPAKGLNYLEAACPGHLSAPVLAEKERRVANKVFTPSLNGVQVQRCAEVLPVLH